MRKPIRYTFDLWIVNAAHFQEGVAPAGYLPAFESIKPICFNATFSIGTHLLTSTCRLHPFGTETYSTNATLSKNLLKVRTATLFEVSAGFVDDLNMQGQRVKTAVRRVNKGEEYNIPVWQRAMRANDDQARESILREEVLSEHWFLFELDGRTYLFATMIEGISHTASYSRLAGDLFVDQAHKKFKTCWDRSFVSPTILVS